MLWSLDGGLARRADRKRQDRQALRRRPVVRPDAGRSGPRPYEAADQLLAAQTAATEDWDALVRRGVFVHPEVWGSAAPGTGGGEDIYQIPEVANADPQVFALWPHAASLLLRGGDPAKERTEAAPRAANSRRGVRRFSAGSPTGAGS